MLVVDEHAVRLDVVGVEALESPRPQLLQVGLGEQERLAAEEGERTALPLDRGLHRLEVVGARDVPGVALRVLVAVLALDIAGHAQRSQLDAHIRTTEIVPLIVPFTERLAAASLNPTLSTPADGRLGSRIFSFVVLVRTA